MIEGYLSKLFNHGKRNTPYVVHNYKSSKYNVITSLMLTIKMDALGYIIGAASVLQFLNSHIILIFFKQTYYAGIVSSFCNQIGN